MNYLQHEITSITKNIWNTVLNMEVQNLDGDVSPSDCVKGRFLTGVVQIEGKWRGVVSLRYPSTLAKEVAARIFSVPLEKVSLEDMRDAMAEMVNMTGGNLKGALPKPSTLSIPTVGEGTDYTIVVNGTRLLNCLAFQCGGETFWVSVFETPRKNDFSEDQSHEATFV